MKLEMKVNYYDGDPGNFIRVKEENCTGCGLCAKFCVRKVWVKQENKYFPINLKDCVECGACWNICAADAIIFNEPKGGTGVKFSYG